MNNAGKYTAATLAAATAFACGLAIKWEGGRRYEAFKPIPTDPWTICDGHTRGVYEGMRATDAQCDAWKREDMGDAQRVVIECIDWPLTSNQLGALQDGVYNIGPKVVCGSTLQRRANAGDIEGACRELTHARNKRGEERGWAYSAGKWMQGLMNRRVDERIVCWPDFSNVIGGPHA